MLEITVTSSDLINCPNLVNINFVCLIDKRLVNKTYLNYTKRGAYLDFDNQNRLLCDPEILLMKLRNILKIENTDLSFGIAYRIGQIQSLYQLLAKNLI